MHHRCGVLLDPWRCAQLESRLAAVARQYGFRSVDELVGVACSAFAPRRLERALINALTSHDTGFFRDASFFDVLACLVLPRVHARLGETEVLRIWCAGCSTGQEAYSVAILLADKHPALLARTEIIATDVADLVLERARAANYSVSEVGQGLQPAHLGRHFEQTADGYRVGEHLRSRIRFRCGNLLDCHETGASFHVIVCRNVLSSFAPNNRVLVATRLNVALRPGGYIGIGQAEEIPGKHLLAGWYAPSP